MIFPVSTGTPEKIIGCLLKFFDCWKPPRCSLRALGTITGCCRHCQPGEATAQLDLSLAVFWLKAREMENAQLQGGQRVKETKSLAHKKFVCPSHQPCSCPFTWAPLLNDWNHKGQIMSTNVSKIWCPTRGNTCDFWYSNYSLTKHLMFWVAFNVKRVAETWVWSGGEVLHLRPLNIYIF